jgi:phosphomannomutase
MDATRFLSLQNGSDIRGVAVEGVEGENVNLDAAIVHSIALAFARWLSDKTGKPYREMKISVGRDSRISGPGLASAFADGLMAAGVTAVDCGLASTPAMYMSTVFDDTRFDGAAMLTASHLPFNRNGIKLFTPAGGLDKPEITEILKLAASVGDSGRQLRYHSMTYNLIDRYAAHLVDMVRKEVAHPDHYLTPLGGFHIVVDAGNGAGGFYAGKVLGKLGADISGSCFLDPDGMFPNHVPNPEDTKAMAFISKATTDSKADFGLIFDTDVDRAAAVDAQGNAINRNNLIALIGAIVLEEHPGSTVVTDSITSDGLSDFLTFHLGGRHHRFKRGYKNVINEALRLNASGEACWLAIETSGHAALRENYFMDDGAYLVTKLIIKAARMRFEEGKNLFDLIIPLRIPAESLEFRLKIRVSDFKDYGNRVITELEEFVQSVPGWQVVPDNYEGIRVTCDEHAGKGWFLLRLSLHDPVIPLNVESDEKGGVAKIVGRLTSFLQLYPDCELDKSAIFTQS